MSWADSRSVAQTALNDAGFRGFGGAEVEELALILERDTRLEELIDGEYLEDAASHIRYLTTSYILTQW